MGPSPHFLVHFPWCVDLLGAFPLACIKTGRILCPWISLSTKAFSMVLEFNSSASPDRNALFHLGERFFALFADVAKVYFGCLPIVISPILRICIFLLDFAHL